MARPAGPVVRRRILVVRRSLRALDRALAGLATAIRNAPPATATSSTRRRSNLSPAGRAALKLQGQYMGYMRQLKPMQKALVRAVLAKRGKRAAIKKARELARKRKAA